jgi:hydroxypyruvate isomerase
LNLVVSSEMNNILQSVAWWGFVPEKLSPEQFVRAVAETGYAAIDLVPQEYWSLVTSYGLAISSSEAHASITLGLNRYDQHERIEHEIRTKLALAQEWCIPNLICFSGSRSGLSNDDGIDIAAAGLVRVAAAAEGAGITLVLELLNSKVDHPDYQADHTQWGVQVCQRVDSPRVKLLYDIYHMQIMEGDIIRTIQAVHPLIGHYHTAGNPGRNELDETQEINYPAVWRTIAATGYRGYMAHEFIPKGDPVEALQTTYRQCAACL